MGTTVDYNSNARRYSAWITYIDRESFNSFLSLANLTTKANAMREAAVALAGLGTSVSDLGSAARAIGQTASIAEAVITTAAAADSTGYAVELGTAVPTLIQSLNDDKTPQQIIDDIHSVLSPYNYGEETVRFIVSAAISITLCAAVGTLAIATPVSLIFSAAVYAANMASMAFFDVSSGIAWLGMLNTYSARLPGRILRYYGMW